MAHTGEKVILRLIQLLDLFLLLYGELLLLLIEMILEQKQYPREESRHNDGAGGVKIGLGRGVLQNQVRIKIGNIIARQCLQGTQHEEHRFPPALQRDADIDETEHKPLGYTAVDSASGEKDHGKQHKQQQHRGCGARIDAFLLDADSGHRVHIDKTCRQYNQIRRKPAQNQYKYQSNHADARDQTEHTFPQADPMVKNDFQPFFNHANPRCPFVKESRKSFPGIPVTIFLYKPAILSQTSAYICSRTE